METKYISPNDDLAVRRILQPHKGLGSFCLEYLLTTAPRFWWKCISFGPRALYYHERRSPDSTQEVSPNRTDSPREEIRGQQPCKLGIKRSKVMVIDVLILQLLRCSISLSKNVRFSHI